MIVEHTPKGYRAFCFTCHQKGWIPKHRSLAERIQDMQAKANADNLALTSLSLPEGEADPSLWPDHARVWLHKAGLSVVDIQRLGFLYSQTMDRVIMPIRVDGVLKFWQARGFDPKLPKYLSPSKVNRKKLIPRYGKSNSQVVLTEDLISAVKCGYVTEAWTLLGTEMHDPVLIEIIRRGLNVVVALDPDRAGMTAATEITLKLRAFGVKCVNITPDLPSDPKLMSREALASLLLSQEFK